MGNKLPLAEIMMMDINYNDVPMSDSDRTRAYLFCMDMENVGYELLEEEYSENRFHEKFIEKIKESSGYHSFVSFCEVDEDGLLELAGKVYSLLH